ncbi:dynein heavy chain 7, axonemal protein (macronuclear) [Tetrahymena thermophila SB210]|uniref:Dynein heavy chain 7, axonemal protein n=1 Tax=Tetrahymena thermophila (strain SB210) TaxID=312017 RepID=Q23R22_TETTS|nr:dynein heavy chain 7, axonemal protein [Tetrahymena thermophila SB210]EAR99019.2 dynein heavy chain 7, axonemal protein [Tetrahymena thermophila SB210]|eukprot:XP_001019264.2 dynein heavy chain 7, axonemal protein [Tetrahymena thermophila SB210]
MDNQQSIKTQLKQTRPLNTNNRAPSAKIIRHEMAIEKYKIYETQKLNDKKINEMMRGVKQVEFVQKPGEFFVLSSQQNSRPKISTQQTQQSINSSKIFGTILDSATKIYENSQSQIRSMSTTRQRIISTSSIHNQSKQSPAFFNNSNNKLKPPLNIQNQQAIEQNNLQKMANTFHINNSNNKLQNNFGQEEQSPLPSIQYTEQESQRENKTILRPRRSQSLNKFNQTSTQFNNDYSFQMPQNNNDATIQNQTQNNFYQEESPFDNRNQETNEFNQSRTQSSMQVKKPKLTQNLKIILSKQDTQMLINSTKLISEIVQDNLNINEKIQENTNRMNSTMTAFKKTSQSFVNLQKQLNEKSAASSFLMQQLKEENTNNVNKSQIMKDAKGNDKKDNVKKNLRSHSYQILQRTQVKNKHISGYQTIVINHKLEEKIKEEERKQKEELKKKQTSKIIDYSKISPYIIGDEEAEKKINARNQLFCEEQKLTKFDKKEKNYFLPLDYYNLDEEDLNPHELLNKYYDSESNTIQGYSKWFQNDGKFEWQPCTVLGYNEESQRYVIKWNNGKEKLVSRVNLRFKGESQEQFEKKLEIANIYREISEYYIKYNLMIDTMEDETSTLSDDIIDRVIIFATNYPFKLSQYRNPIEFYQLDPLVKFNFKFKMFPKQIDIPPQKTLENILDEKKIKHRSLLALKNEIMQLFVRSNRQIKFDNTLPFSEEKQQYFKGILPDYMFIPITERVKDNRYYATLDVGYSQNHNYTKFLNLYSKMSQTCMYSIDFKLEQLRYINDARLSLEQMSLIETDFKKEIDISKFQFIQRKKCKDLVKELNNKVYDTNFTLVMRVETETREIQKRNEQLLRTKINEEEKEALRNVEYPKEFIEDIRRTQFQYTLQYERIYRNLYFTSIKQFSALFQKHNNFFKKINNLKFITEDTCNYSHIVNYLHMIRLYQPQESDFVGQIRLIRNEKKIAFSPTFEEWKKAIQDIEDEMYEQMISIRCMRTNEIGLSRPSKTLCLFDQKDQEKDEIESMFENTINETFTIMEMFQKKVNEFEYLLDISGDSVRKKFAKKNNFKDFEHLLQKLRKSKDEFDNVLIGDKVMLGNFTVECADFRKYVEERIKLASKVVYEILMNKINDENSKMENEIENIILKLKKMPENIEEMDQLRKYCNITLVNELAEIKARIDQVMDRMNLLEYMYFKISFEDFAKCWSIYGMPLKLNKKKKKCLQKMLVLEKSFSDDLLFYQHELVEEIKQIKATLELLQKESQIEETDSISFKFAELGDRIDKAQQDADIINRREDILKWLKTDFQIITNIHKEYFPYNRVWQLSKDYSFKIPNIMEGPLSSINREDVCSDIIDSWNELYKMEKGVFKNIPHIKMLCQQVRQKYEDFKPNLPLIMDLRNPNLEKRHWVKINHLIKEHNKKVERKQLQIRVEFDEDLNINLKTLLENNIQFIQDDIREISEIASKEKGFEKILNKMKSEWKPIRLQIFPYKDTGTFVLRGVEPILDRLDEDISKTNSIAASPFVKFFENEVNYWRTILYKMQETIETWCKVQKMWQYLQPIFFSEEIIQEMPREGGKYEFVDKMWRSIMLTTTQIPNCMEACSQSRLKENFQMMIENLESVIKGLNDFLNKKREAYPRFYFLSNDELLQILAQSRDPQAVQPHLPKCFEGIYRLKFIPITLPEGISSSNITHMISKEGEQVEFLNLINPFYFKKPKAVDTNKLQEKAQNKQIAFKQETDDIQDQEQKAEQVIIQETPKLIARGVEDWLPELENNMRETMMDLFKNCLKEHSTLQPGQKNNWLFKWPSQVIIVSDQTLWTSSATEAIIGLEENPQSLVKFFNQLQEDLLDIVSLVRNSNIENIHRIMLGVMIVTNVHQKDIIKSLKDVSNVKLNTESFEWLQHLRYYQVEKKIKNQNTDNLEVRMVNNSRTYGWEYLGNQGRLVITPLTDRCYRTLMSALQQNLGGAPEGPAGTGKTETTKDLAKAIAKHCVVFNCSDALDYIAMGKFFKGLCSCGSWACFDEFNRIELEVLSVIAQQILTIQTAIYKLSLARVVNNNPTFNFEGQNIPLDSSCAIFITMNPGYQGRSELPDNLKALFRPVAMMIPNYTMITEISLYSYGFQYARELAIKITYSLKLASEQLSTQSHYDFGMRAVKSIILAAGTLKRTMDADEDEYYLILKAIRDCNIPKFTHKDVPLFEAILQDLFPTTQFKVGQYELLHHAIKKISETNNLVLYDRFYQKIIELFETIQVRHGLMIVGGALGGKSSILKVLGDSIELSNKEEYLKQHPEIVELMHKLQKEEEERELAYKNLSQIEKRRLARQQTGIDLAPKQEIVLEYDRVKKFFINPKSISGQMLFGDVEEASGEWHDGITALTFRQCQEEDSNHYKWVVFDGPVDALWIENMNTVLDDNKKLCLTNGETIPLANKMSIMFEVENLYEASPATVSRCGMVYLEQQDLKWEVFYTCWYNNLTGNLQGEEQNQFYHSLLEELLKPAIEYLLKKKTPLPVTPQWAAMNFLKMFEGFLLKKKNKAQTIEALKYEQEQQISREKAALLEGKELQAKKKTFSDKEKSEVFSKFLMAMIWSCGGLLLEEERDQFSLVLHNLIKIYIQKEKDIIKSTLPNEKENLFDQRFFSQKMNWNLWKVGGQYKIPPEIQFYEIFIPTTDSIRYTYLLKSLLLHNTSTLFLGKTGTGKTAIHKRLLLNDLDPDSFITTITAFSANIPVNQVQDVLESKLEKQKRKKGVYGPLIGRINIIFVDDINMPNKEYYGAQPPLELIRQYFTYGGWYDRKALEFNQIVDIQITAAMGMGRASISDRLLRHFHLIYLNPTDSNTLFFMTQKILEWGFREHIDKIKFMTQNLSNLCLQVHKQIEKTFLPLPSKSHYLFNFRDLMNVLQGVLEVPGSKYEATGDYQGQILRLWLFETNCVYKDRLIEKKDIFKYDSIIKENLEIYFKTSVDKIMFDFKGEPIKDLLFGNFKPDNVYQELNMDQNTIRKLIQDHIDSYNRINNQKINIVVFHDAIQLLSKINRIINQTFSHALLIGLGGSGAHTLTRLATFISGYTIQEIEGEKSLSIDDWKDQMRQLLKNIVMKEQRSVLLLSDSQFDSELYFEDINNLLNLGEIPNLFQGEERENMISDLKDHLQKYKINLNSMQLWEHFVGKCRLNLHITLCMSPVGDKLRNRIRNFPSLVNCSSIIWVQPWSESSLKDVANQYLNTNKEVLQLDEAKAQSVSNLFLYFHKSVEQIAIEYHQTTNQHYYVTPSSYLKLLNNFSDIYQKQLLSLLRKKDMYENGVKKLDLCTEVVEQMKKELQDLQPILVIKTKETENIMVEVEEENVQAELQREIVQKDEIQTKEKADIAQAIQEQCKEKLSLAEPQLKEALTALKTLKKEDFIEMKSFQKPPALIKITMDAVCILLGVKGKKGQDKQSIDYWEESKKLLSEPILFIRKLEKYEKDNIPDLVIQKMKQFLSENSNFKPQIIAKASKAAEGLCKWANSIYEYHFVFKSILPLREDLDRANQALESAQKLLEKKRQLLQQVEEKCFELRIKLDSVVKEKQRLIDSIKECQVKLDRALDLTQGLSVEKIRWSESSKKLKLDIDNFLGDMLIAVGAVSYFGPLSGEFRKRIVSEKWKPKILEQNIVCSSIFSLLKCLGDPLQAQEWVIHGLPFDETSQENIIIMNNSRNYPLFLDPQKQAIRFLRKYESRKDEKNLSVCKPKKQIQKAIEMAIRMGQVLIIDGVDDQIEPILKQILDKNIIVSGGQKQFQIGQVFIDYNENFRFCLVNYQQNPHYTPDLLSKVCLLNFKITPDAMKDQMISILMKEEEPALEEEKIRLMQENKENQENLANIEKEILRLLNTTDGNKMLDDEQLIISLKQSKQFAEDVQQRIKESRFTEEKIRNARFNFEQTAELASNIFFTIQKLHKLNPMYQFSLEFFIKVFKKSIKKAEKPQIKNPKNKTNCLNDSLKKQVYYDMNRSIFVKHKLLFSFLLTLTVIETNEALNINDYHYFLSGIVEEKLQNIDNPEPSKISEKQWNSILELSTLDSFKNIAQFICRKPDSWIKFIQAPDLNMPEPFSKVPNFAKLVLVKSLRPDFFAEFLKEFIKTEMGSYFIENVQISIQDTHQESIPEQPILFVLSPGDNPQEELKKFAQDCGKYLTFISLGKGQGQIAEESIQDCIQAGSWCILQNCHLAISWLPRLEEIVEDISLNLKKDYQKFNPDFRLWLTSMPTEKFPSYLVQDSIKITKDPPRGIKANIQQLYENQTGTKDDRKYYESVEKPEWRVIFLSLSFFHAIVRERRRYGPVGWNVNYDFNESDFKISVRQLKIMIETYPMIPFNALSYLIAECYYGGKVTDDWDRRLIKSLLNSFINEEMIYGNYNFSEVKEYTIPEEEQIKNLDDTINFINQMPDLYQPELYGLNSNAAITSATLETNRIIQDTILARGSGIGQKKKESNNESQGQNESKLLQERANTILQQTPEEFDIDIARQRFQINYYESMNTVLIQELLRYNTLLGIIKKSLKDLIKASDGIIVMTSQIDSFAESINNNKIPDMWKSKSYPSLKPLLSYHKDLCKRIEMFKNWLKDGIPKVFWLSGFYFTQSFFTGVKQNYARKNKIPIDEIDFKFDFIDPRDLNKKQMKDVGCLTNGLFLEGGRWNFTSQCIDEAEPKQLFSDMPIVHFIPHQLTEYEINQKQNQTQSNNKSSFYECPLYKTSERKGQLSTTGHSTNFILSILLPTNKNQDHWIKRGLALLTQLDD